MLAQKLPVLQMLPRRARRAIATAGEGAVGVLLSPQLSTQEAVAALALAGAGATIAVGAGRSAAGYQVEADELLIVADKNPNRAGVSLVANGAVDVAALDGKIGGDIKVVVLVGSDIDDELSNLDKADEGHCTGALCDQRRADCATNAITA